MFPITRERFYCLPIIQSMHFDGASRHSVNSRQDWTISSCQTLCEDSISRGAWKTSLKVWLEMIATSSQSEPTVISRKRRKSRASDCYRPRSSIYCNLLKAMHPDFACGTWPRLALADLAGNQKPDQTGGRPPIDLYSMEVNSPRTQRNQRFRFNVYKYY